MCDVVQLSSVTVGNHCSITCLTFILHAAASCVNLPATSFCACLRLPCVCLQGKRLDIVRSEVVLADLVGDVHCIIEAMIGRGGSVQLHPPQLHSVPNMVCCDPDRLRGVLLNLYTNAGEQQGGLALGPGSNLQGLCKTVIRRLKLSL
jgi:hypothetical protein